MGYVAQKPGNEAMDMYIYVGIVPRLPSETSHVRMRMRTETHADGSPLLGLHWATVRLRAHILLRKLTLLCKLLLSEGDEFSFCIFCTLAAKNVYNNIISLVQQCQSLESEYGTTCVKQCLEDRESARSVLAEAKVEIVRKDWLLFLDKFSTHSSRKHVFQPIASS